MKWKERNDIKKKWRLCPHFIEKIIWWFYSHKEISFLLLLIIEYSVITWIIYKLNLKWNYDIRAILKAVLDEELIKSLPLPLALIINLMIFLSIPLMIKKIFEVQLFPAKIPKVLNALQDRCWEIYKLGLVWLRDDIQKIVDKVDGFRTGLQLPEDEIKEIVNALYEITCAKEIYATWFLDISNLSDSEKTYILLTHNKIRALNKLKLSRFIISNVQFTNLFPSNPNDNLRWFVQQHNAEQFDLYYIEQQKFNDLLSRYGISPDRADVLFFDGSLAFIIILDQTTFKPYYINNNLVLLVTDTKTDIEKYSNFFAELKLDSTNVFNEIRQKGYESRYGIS